MPQELVAADHITKSFGGVQALRDVSVTLHQGEIRCLVGENGSGKSTLIQIIAGALRPDSGTIAIGGKQFPHLEPIQAIHEGIQVIYQDFSLFPNLTVAENLALNTELERGVQLVSWRRVRRIAVEAMARLGRDIDLGQTVRELSVADKQLVAIAKALLQNAKVLILDEPTTALTHREVRTLFEVIPELKQRGLAILFVGHKLQEILEISDTITVLRNGQKVAESDASQFTPGDLVRHMTGRSLPDRPSERACEQWHQHPADDSSAGRGPPTRNYALGTPSRCHRADAVFKVTDLTDRDAFDSISLEVSSGEIVGITGLLGSGRTELARSLFGLEPADSGRIEISGQVIRMRSVQDAIRVGIAYVPEDRLTEGVFAEQSIERNLAISALPSFAGRAGWIRPASLRRAAGQSMTELRIQAPSARMPVANLSGGNQQKVVLGRWLATQAKILILNGPTVGIDVGAKSEVHEKIRELARQGMAVLLISDDLPELVELCRRILLMHRGRIVKELAGADCNEDTLAAELGRLE
ncbi:MAG: sugar ABC transporter ATP-binding protein [Planctomycetes bacterium]|nr:sugar ABC transporter ATP-binding protein [Planctomycetota bacterium]